RAALLSQRRTWISPASKKAFPAYASSTGAWRARGRVQLGWNSEGRHRMARPVTLFSGQWADLPFAVLCQKARSFGFDGIELACQGDQMDARRAGTDSRYLEEKKAVLREHKLQVFALGGHLA